MAQVDSLKTGEKFKKTEIGEIPVDWEVRKVVELCLLGRGRVISQKEIDNSQGPYPVYSSQSKESGSMGSINTYDFDGEYVTWTTDGAYAGTVFYRRGRFNCTNVCGTLMSKVPFVDMLFLSFALSKITKRHVVYCGNPKLMNNVMAQISVQIPPRAEQKKIAEILTTVDTTIEKSDQVIEKTKELKKGLMQQLLTRGIGHTKFKKTEIGEIPVDWEVGTIKNHTAVITKGTTPSTYGYPYTNQGILFFRIENIDKQGHISLKEVKYISEETDKFLSRSRLQTGDILFSIAGALGRVTVITENLLPANVNQALAIIRLNDNTLNKEYLKYTLQSKIIKTQINLLAVQLAQANLNLQQVGNIKFPLPNIDEQKKIVEILTSVDEQIEKENANKEELEMLKNGLMQVLLTGKVRVRI